MGTEDRIKSARLGTDLQFSPAAVVGGKKSGSHENAKPWPDDAEAQVGLGEPSTLK